MVVSVLNICYRTKMCNADLSCMNLVLVLKNFEESLRLVQFKTSCLKDLSASFIQVKNF